MNCKRNHNEDHALNFYLNKIILFGVERQYYLALNEKFNLIDVYCIYLFLMSSELQNIFQAKPLKRVTFYFKLIDVKKNK